MKYLKIEDNKGFFQKPSSETDLWEEIDKINKEDLLILLDKAISSEFEMDDYNEDLLGHKAHQIVYKNLFDKFSELLENKTRFKDISESLYKGAFEKYSETESNG